MKQFFKFIFASCLGTLLALATLFLILMLVGAIAASQNSGIASGSILELDFDSAIPEKSNNVPQSGFTLEREPSIGLHKIVKLIDHAKTDPNIEGIIYKASTNTPLGIVTASTIKDALKDFAAESDKFLYSYADFYTNNSYLIASPSDSIFINPNGTLDVNGGAAMIPFFKGFMEKIGVKMNVFYAGQFKSATEPFRRKEMSEQNRIQTREYLDDNYQLFLSEVSDSRNIPVSQIKNIINELDFDNTQAALDNQLVDALMYWYELEDLLRAKLDIKEGKSIKYVTLSDYDKNTTISKGKGKDKIAVIYAEGEVVYQDESRGSIDQKTYHKVFDKIRKDKKVKAVVLRVNSPGGSAFTSDVIWDEMKALKEKGLPVIASFGDYAASGGYYVAACADTIVAHPKTLTGSIGVFSMLPDFTEAMEDKLGITFDTVKTSPHAIVMSPFLKYSPEEGAALQRYTDQMYDDFLGIVAEGRGTTKEDIHKVAQGRVWTGQKASTIGLVDVLGGLDVAIDIAAQKANTDDYKVVEYPYIKKEIWEEFMEGLATSTKMKFLNRFYDEPTNEFVKAYKDVEEILKYREPLARMPFTIVNQ